MNGIVILTTVDSAELGRKIANALVQTGLAACVNIVPGVRSVYRWQGKLCDEEELLLVIKTTAERFEDVRRHIRGLHTYQVPEVISLSIADGDSDYLCWLRDQVAGRDGASLPAQARLMNQSGSVSRRTTGRRVTGFSIAGRASPGRPGFLLLCLRGPSID